MTIYYFFLYLWVIFALLDPDLDPDLDPATQIDADPCGSGSTTLQTNNETKNLNKKQLNP
jgi:hypothetical protein